MIHTFIPVTRPALASRLIDDCIRQGATAHAILSIPGQLLAARPGLVLYWYDQTRPQSPAVDMCYAKLNLAIKHAKMASDDWVHCLGDDDGLPENFYGDCHLDSQPDSVACVFVPVRWNRCFSRPVCHDNIAVGYMGLQQPIVRAWVKQANPYLQACTSADGYHGVWLRNNVLCRYRSQPEVYYNQFEAGKEWPSP